MAAPSTSTFNNLIKSPNIFFFAKLYTIELQTVEL
jgi:hypothetical protein